MAENGGAGAQTAEAGVKSTKKGLILIIVGVLLLALAAAGGAWYFLGQASETPAEEEVQAAKKTAIYVKLRTTGGKPSFIANLEGNKGRARFLQVYAEVLTRDQDVADAVKKHMPLVVYRLSTLFAAQDFVALQTAAGREHLQQEATRTVQQVLQEEIGRPGIEKVFFTNLVMQ